jgi:hypothetical protein
MPTMSRNGRSSDLKSMTLLLNRNLKKVMYRELFERLQKWFRPVNPVKPVNRITPPREPTLENIHEYYLF